MGRIYESITELIGRTPLLNAKNFAEKNNLKATILTKLEYFNPAGSVKDRVGAKMIEDAESKGLQVKEQIDGGNYGIAVCEHDGMVVGFITYRIDGVWGEICNNAACPPEGVKGIGQCMYAYVKDVFRQNGVKFVKVVTGLDYAHAPARRAYERAGFVKHLDSTTYFMELD